MHCSLRHSLGERKYYCIANIHLGTFNVDRRPEIVLAREESASSATGRAAATKLDVPGQGVMLFKTSPGCKRGSAPEERVKRASLYAAGEVAHALEYYPRVAALSTCGN